MIQRHIVAKYRNDRRRRSVCGTVTICASTVNTNGFLQALFLLAERCTRCHSLVHFVHCIHLPCAKPSIFDAHKNILKHRLTHSYSLLCVCCVCLGRFRTRVVMIVSWLSLCWANALLYFAIVDDDGSRDFRLGNYCKTTLGAFGHAQTHKLNAMHRSSSLHSRCHHSLTHFVDLHANWQGLWAHTTSS